MIFNASDLLFTLFGKKKTKKNKTFFKWSVMAEAK